MCDSPATFVVYDEDADEDGRMVCDYHLPTEIRSRPVLTVSVFNVEPPAPGYSCEDGEENSANGVAPAAGTE